MTNIEEKHNLIKSIFNLIKSIFGKRIDNFKFKCFLIV